MQKKCLFWGLICSFLFGSCPIPDEKSLAFYFYIRFAKGIERRVIYNTEQSINEIPFCISFKNEIVSRISEFNPISSSKYYVNYSVPFEFYIRISLLDKKIKEIEFSKCKLIISDNDFNLFDTSNENIKLSEYKEWKEGIQFFAGSYKGDFYEEHKIIVNNTDEYYISGFSLSFKELQFDYYINEEIKIIYDVVIIDEDDNIIEHTFEIIFERRFEEKKNNIWEEINLDEWKKNI